MSCVQAYKFSWVEAFSEQDQLVYYYNQETKQSTWDRPADLAWRRVPVEEAA